MTESLTGGAYGQALTKFESHLEPPLQAHLETRLAELTLSPELMSLRSEVALARLMTEDVLATMNRLREANGRIPAQQMAMVMAMIDQTSKIVKRAAEVEALQAEAMGGSYEKRLLLALLEKKVLEEVQKTAPGAVSAIQERFKVLAGGLSEISVGAIGQVEDQKKPEDTSKDLEVTFRPIEQDEDGVVRRRATAHAPETKAVPAPSEVDDLNAKLKALLDQKTLRGVREASKRAGNGDGNGHGPEKKEAV